jgi:hypothetical protein
MEKPPRPRRARRFFVVGVRSARASVRQGVAPNGTTQRNSSRSSSIGVMRLLGWLHNRQSLHAERNPPSPHHRRQRSPAPSAGARHRSLLSDCCPAPHLSPPGAITSRPLPAGTSATRSGRVRRSIRGSGGCCRRRFCGWSGEGPQRYETCENLPRIRSEDLSPWRV